MARDHRRLRVFNDAHRLVVDIYLNTREFPRDEWFGMRAQIRRCAVSIPSNIVEGNARRSTADYLNFLNIARGSAGELNYLVALATELGYLPDKSAGLQTLSESVIRQLEGLIEKMATLQAVEASSKREARNQKPKTRDQRPA